MYNNLSQIGNCNHKGKKNNLYWQNINFCILRFLSQMDVYFLDAKRRMENNLFISKSITNIFWVWLHIN